MKRIGLVTWFGGSNYGTSLQAFALNYVILKLGAECFLMKKCLTWRNVARLILIRIKRNKLQNIQNGLHPQKERKIKQFKKLHFKSFPQRIGIIGRALFKRDDSTLDCVVAGSDQIWNPYYTEPYFLLQDINILKYSYASSIGVEEFPTNKIKLYQNTLSKYEKISSREETAINILEKLSGKKVFKVLDPTFLLSANEWNSFAEEKTLENFNTNSPYILCYFIAENSSYLKNLKRIQERAKIHRIVILPMKPSHFIIDGEIIEDAGLQDFIYLINHANLICTDSFHASAISINLNKNFVTFLRFKSNDKSSQNSRIENLLFHYCLHDRLYIDEKDLNKDFITPIDYKRTNLILQKDREDSFAYLRDIVNN